MTNKVDFLNHLKLFLSRKGTIMNRIPKVGGIEVDFFFLFKSVTERKGFDECMKLSKMKWKEVVTNYQRNVTIPKTCTNLSYILREKYKTYLYDYEQTYYHNKGQLKKVDPKPEVEEQNSMIILKTAKKHDLPEGEKKNVLPFLKRKKLYLSKKQLVVVRKIECCLTARNNFKQIDWALSTLLALCSNFKKNNFSLLMIDFKNVFESLSLNVRHYIDDLKEENGLGDIEATTETIVQSILPPPPPPRIFHDIPLTRRRASEKRSLLSLNIFRVLSENKNNIPFFLSRTDSTNSSSPSSVLEFFITILEELQKVSKRFKTETDFEEDGIHIVHNNMRHYILCFFQNLSGELYLGRFPSPVSSRFFDVYQDILLSPNPKNTLCQSTIQILHTFNYLFSRNELIFEKHFSEKKDLLNFLVGLLSTEIGPFKNDHIARTLSLELFHKFIVTSLMISRKFKKKLVKYNGLIPRLIKLIQLKSNFHGEDITTYDDMLRKEKEKEQEEEEKKKKNKQKDQNNNTVIIPQPPGDYFQMMCVSILRYFAKKRAKALGKYLGEIKVCVSIAQDEEVVKELMTIVNSLEKKRKIGVDSSISSSVHIKL